MNTTSGETTFRRFLAQSKPGVHSGIPVYTIRWKSAQLEYMEAKQNYGGTMQDVSGVLYVEGKEVSTFTADSAEADKETGFLRLSGHVHVISEDTESKSNATPAKPVVRHAFPPGDLFCDRLEVVNQLSIIKARGNVQVKDGHGTMGGDEFWATPDLRFVSTPDLFSSHLTLF